MTLLSKIKDFYTNLKATFLIIFGIVVIALAVGGAIFQFSLTALPAIIITFFGTFLGTWLFASGLNKLIVSPFDNDKIRLKEAESQLDQEKQENQRLKVENHNLNQRLKTHVNITKIQSALQLVTGIVSFDITDYRSKEEKVGDIKHKLSMDKDKKYSQEKVFYRGVFHCSGDLKLATNLENLKIYVPVDSDEIIVTGIFDYNSSLITETYKKGWLMKGRREKEILYGPDEEHMKTAAIEVELGKEGDNEEKQENDNWDKLSKVADKFDFMKINSDEMIKQLIKIMLQPTGKTVKFIEDEKIENPRGQITTLKRFIEEYNQEIDKRTEQPALLSSAE